MEIRTPNTPVADRGAKSVWRALIDAALVLALCSALPPAWGAEESNTESAGAIRLTSPRQVDAAIQAPDSVQRRARVAYKPGEFEVYVNSLQGLAWPDADQAPAGWIRRLGADVAADEPVATELGRQASPDYILGPGDEIQVTIWGVIDGDLRLTVDRAGRVVIPRVGPVLLAGVRYGDLNEVIRARISQVFKNFQVSAALGKLRSIRVYVTGYAARPGSYTVSSLATVANVINLAGGPSPAGSIRRIELRRGGRPVSTFDYYDLILKGDQSSDRVLQADDVVHITPAGAQVAILGSVNKPAILELHPGETAEDVIAMAGGFSPVADSRRLELQRLSERNDRRSVELQLPEGGKTPASNGDIFRAYSAIGSALPQHKQYKRVHVEGEVAKPGYYLLPPSSVLGDAIRSAGGLTPNAFLFGTEFTRVSTRRTQQENYDRALRDLELEFTRSATTTKTQTSDDAVAQSARAAGASRLIERLRSVQPTGRVVLRLTPEASELPPLALEDGDHINIPATPTTVGVFGSVYNTGNFLVSSSNSIQDMLAMAGGPTRGADVNSLFVLRANGTVISSRQSKTGWLSLGGSVMNTTAFPGDTIFVPEEMSKTTFIQEAKEWTQILYQFGIGAAALKTLKN